MKGCGISDAEQYIYLSKGYKGGMAEMWTETGISVNTGATGTPFFRFICSRSPRMHLPMDNKASGGSKWPR